MILHFDSQLFPPISDSNSNSNSCDVHDEPPMAAHLSNTNMHTSCHYLIVHFEYAPALYLVIPVLYLQPLQWRMKIVVPKQKELLIAANSDRKVVSNLV